MVTSLDDAKFWDEKYKKNDTPWNMNSANPVFIELLSSNDFISPSYILITGCGKGLDAIAAAKAGYKVTAVDFSESAVKNAGALAENENVKINFLAEDIFELDKKYDGQFDVVYEYTTYCAINPARREEYAEKISSLIKKNGKLAAVLFPVDGREGGPPFNIDVIQFYTFFSRYLKLQLSSNQINSVKPRRGKEILQIYIKK